MIVPKTLQTIGYYIIIMNLVILNIFNYFLIIFEYSYAYHRYKESLFISMVYIYITSVQINFR